VSSLGTMVKMGFGRRSAMAGWRDGATGSVTVDSGVCDELAFSLSIQNSNGLGSYVKCGLPHPITDCSGREKLGEELSRDSLLGCRKAPKLLPPKAQAEKNESVRSVSAVN